jgi:hypothetical protein
MLVLMYNDNCKIEILVAILICPSPCAKLMTWSGFRIQLALECALTKNLVATFYKDLFDSVGENHDESRFKNHVVAHVCIVTGHHHNGLLVRNSTTNVLKKQASFSY